MVTYAIVTSTAVIAESVPVDVFQRAVQRIGSSPERPGVCLCYIGSWANLRKFKWLSGMDKAETPPAGSDFAEESKTRLAASAVYMKAARQAIGR